MTSGAPFFSTSGRYLFGVVHLLPLPGSPGYRGDPQAVRESARRDADHLLAGGLDGFIVENFGDVPFHKNQVELAVVAEMTRIVTELVERAGPEPWIGVNVLRNDAAAALSVATAAGARFIRVNVHAGVMFADQGIIEGKAADTLRLRKKLASSVAILADVAVKHAVAPAGFELGAAAQEAAYRGLADGLVVTGPSTGSPSELEEVDEVRLAVPDRPIWVGSGVTDSTVAETLRHAHGVIVGTSLKEDGDVRRPVDPARVKQLVALAMKS